MGVYDEYRIEMALDKLKRSKVGVYLTNLFVFTVLAYVKITSLLKEKWKKRFSKNKVDFSQIWDKELPPRFARSKPRVMIIGEMLNKQCRLYRVDQKAQQLERLGWHCEVFSWQQLNEAEARLFNIDIVIFYRVVGVPKILALIDHIRSLNKITVFDVDDLVFDKDLLLQKYQTESELLPNDVKQGNLHAADLYKLTAQHCDYAITTTQTLQSLLAELVLQKKCFILPNALSEEAYRIAALPQSNKPSDKITLLYGSGSQTHDDDFQEVANALARLLHQHNNLQVAVVGKLNLPAQLAKFSDRIIRLPILDFASYLMFVRQSDINIAPLQTDIFNDAKSEIKWLEAALFEIPTVMTPTKTYQQVVVAGVTGFFAESEEQWFSHMNRLIESQSLREEVGRNAKQAAIEVYGRQVMSEQIDTIMQEIQEHALSAGILHKQLSVTKKSILIVDSYYSPKDAQYDPMISVRRQVEQLELDHVGDFEILVVTADSEDTDKYVINNYALNGVPVRVMGVGVEFERINDYQNPRIKKTFKEIVDFFAPDVIHFHHLEILSGSVLEVAKESSIPYVITIYDTAWWLNSDQFVIPQESDANDVLPDLDPFSTIDQQANVNDKITRTIYLIGLLSHAEKVFTLTITQYEVFQLNGIKSILLPEGVGDPTSIGVDAENVIKTSTKKKLGLIGFSLDSNDLFICALNTLSENNDSAQLEIYARDFTRTPDYKDEIAIANTIINARGSWLNHHDVSQFIGSMNIIILSPDWHLQSDLIFQEASARGIKVIAPNSDVLAGIVNSNEDAYSYSLDDPNDLITVLTEVMTKAKKECDSSIFSVSDNVKELASHYQDIHSSNHSETL